MIISSLLSLQSGYLKDKESIGILKETKTGQGPWPPYMNDYAYLPTSV
jgi:hypothetical protein